VIASSNIQEEASTSVVQNNEEQQSLMAEEEVVVTDAKPIIQNVEEENNLETEEKEVVNQLVYEEIYEEPVTEKEIIATDNSEIAEERSAVPSEIVSEEQIVVVGQAVEEINIEREPSTNKTSKAGLDFFDEDAISDMTAGHRREKHWELGLAFSPEWITIPDNDNNITSYGLDLTAQYHIGNWFVESGIGASFSKDEGDLNSYNEAIFKGSYQYVYDVTYDTSNNNVVPIYHTKEVNVYDTVFVEKSKNSYAYLNIPLNFGYTTMLGNKFSFHTKLGVNAGIKIYEDIPKPENEGNIIIKNELYHKRTSWNMQAMVNVGIDYHITNQFLFGVEPNARYYIKSLVEDNKAGNPYGFGVKLGFKYILK